MKRRRKLSAILKSKKFYIYMKNHSLYSKYETKLKSLGAVISQFLDKEVNYVLTDIPGCNGKVSVKPETLNVLSPCYSVSPATSVSGDDSGTSRKTRTRAEAMLERIPVSTQLASSLNPIADAVSLNIPVYSVEFFQKWLDKKLAQIQIANDKSETKCEGNTRIFQQKYLKLESVLLHHYRPEFKEVSKWPCIDTNTLAGSCPFDRKIFKKSGKKENHADKKKESERMNRTCNNKTVNEAGYCEICAVHYSDLSQHVASSSHMKFISNEKNYADLDNCIKTRSVEAFLAAHNSTGNNSHSKETNSNEAMGRNLKKSVSLHLNNNNENSAVTRSLSNAKLLADESLKQPLQVQCNGFTNYHLRKTGTAKSDSVIKSPGYYPSKDLLRESRKPYSCPETTAPVSAPKDRQPSPVREETVHRLRSRKSLFLPSILLGTTAEDGPNKTRLSISPQTPSNHFLRSSVSPKSHYATRSRIPAGTDDDKRGHVGSPVAGGNSGIYFTRSKLSSGSPNETDKRHSRSSVSPRDENQAKQRRKPSATTASDEDDSSNVASYQNRKRNNLCNDTSQQIDRGQRKRLSCEEKFLEDNREYYKVEMLRTKLRSTEFYCNQEISQIAPTTKKDADGKIEPIQETAELDANGEPVVMRFKKIKQRKQSALSLLNLEAEKFLFGPPKRDSSDESSDSDDENGEDSGDRVEDKNQPEASEKNDDRKASGSSTKNVRRTKGKKRRTHAEVFIHDNLDYYRFEISGSRLRHQNADGTDVLVKNEPGEKANLALMPSCMSSANTVKVKEENVTDEENELLLPLKKRGKGRRKDTNESEKENETEKAPPQKEPVADEECVTNETACCSQTVPPEPISFSFESVPSKEPWYKTFQRYDSCDEFYLELPNNHVSRFQVITNSNKMASARTASPFDQMGSPHHRRRKRSSKLARIIAEDKPRKSPRCHASTLAILSSLTNHRRRSRKMQAIENRRSLNDSRTAIRTETAKTPTPVVNTALQYEAKIKEAVNVLAKDVDEHFIELFGNEDCADRYLEIIRKKEQKVAESTSQAESKEESSHCCMQLDEEIFHDQDFLTCYIDSTSDRITEDMATFMENAQQKCSSMEQAQDEESIIPRSNDLLLRLCRENDYSCNSSDCGASSTCEFLGFAEDGRTVSRKRKRKRPNMTGWPHQNRRRKNIRFSDVARRNNETETNESADSPALANGDNVSEADSECTDDDMPLSEIVSKKRRRTESVTAEVEASPSNDRSNESGNNRVSLRRSGKVNANSSMLPYRKRFTQNQRRGKGKRRRCT